jgi:hypothetical protein
MATPQEKLAHSLEVLRRLQRADGSGAIRSKDLRRPDRECLLKHGFIKEVMKGWYVPSRVDESQGESTAWYASYWRFCAAYLNERFGEEWSLSPEQSLSIHTDRWSVPVQLLVRSPKAGNKVINLLHGTSLLDVRANLPEANAVTIVDGLRLFSLEAALIAAMPAYFKRTPTEARAALSMLKDASTLLERLLEGGHSLIAGRLAGAFRNIGRNRFADDILATMNAAGYTVRETDPFENSAGVVLPLRDTSPQVTRLRLLWQQMRNPIIDAFPEPAKTPKNTKAYLKELEDVYLIDAYHSLSIEGYRVSPEMIERVRSGDWDPDRNSEDRNHRDAMAARGYHLAFQAVKKSVESVLGGANPGVVVERDHGTWYRELFAPSVTAGLLNPTDLAGYRRGQVFIRGSMHVPMKREGVPNAMAAFFELLSSENNPAVRVVLGHFFFVYIHPYMDGNGRIGRFLMNVMLAAGQYPWTIIPVDKRASYMSALEDASVRQQITPFAKFLSDHVRGTFPGATP